MLAMEKKRTVFKRAVKCRKAYRWVRRLGYLVMFSGIGLVMMAKTQTVSGEITRLEASGYIACIAAFCIFLGSYGFYFAIRTIETQINRPEE